MARQIFTSFHYKPDHWRRNTVRNIGAVEGNRLARDNDWESIASQGDAAIKKWIDTQMIGRSCVVVLIGSATAGRKWINYEIEKGWERGKGVFGVHIHNLKDSNEQQSSKGLNPFRGRKVGSDNLNNLVKVYDPPFSTSTNVYNHIKGNIVDWIEEAVEIRKNH